MKMNGAHGAGGGLAAVAALVIIGLGRRAGVTLTNEEAVGLFTGAATIGIGAGHGATKLYAIGVFPFFSHLFHGPKSK